MVLEYVTLTCAVGRVAGVVMDSAEVTEIAN
jgi:hypothetical protein